MEWTSHGLIWGTIFATVQGTKENHKNPEWGQAVIQLRYEPGISQTQSRSAIHETMKFSMFAIHTAANSSSYEVQKGPDFSHSWAKWRK
jgi:hypothetical protein